MIAYVLIIKPQKDKIMLILTAFGEFIMLALHLISLVFLDENLSTQRITMLSWVVLVMVGLYILINWVIVIVITVMDLKASCKRKEKLKIEQKQKLKKDEDYNEWKQKYLI